MKQSFNENGWICPASNQITYSLSNSSYYKLGQYSTREDENLSSLSSYFSLDISPKHAIAKLTSLRSHINKSNVSALFLGPHIPFVLPRSSSDDLGETLELSYFPVLSRSAEDDSRTFKYTLLGTSPSLSGQLHCSTEYQTLFNISQSSHIVGYYFPLALQGYAPSSLLNAYNSVVANVFTNSTLSGPLEICASLVSNNRLLFNTESYSPILCASSVSHQDDKMMLCLKTYGSGIEAWLMSKMLTPTREQVSEQWSGGITIYDTL